MAHVSRISLSLSLCRGENRSIRFIGWSPLPIFLLEGEKRRRVIIARGTHWIPNRSDIRSKLDPILRYPRTESRNHGCHHVSLSPLAAMFSKNPRKPYLLLTVFLSLFLSTFIITIPAQRVNNGRKRTMEVGSQAQVLSFAYSPARTMAARNSSTSEDLILVENGSRIPILFSEGISFQCLFLSLTHSLSLFLSLSLSLSLDDSIPEELSEGRHTDLSRECIVSSHHLFPRIRKGEGLSLSFFLSVPLRRRIEDEFRSSRTRSWKAWVTRSRTDRGPPLAAPYISTTTYPTFGVPLFPRSSNDRVPIVASRHAMA